jgi:hypothetical protein
MSSDEWIGPDGAGHFQVLFARPLEARVVDERGGAFAVRPQATSCSAINAK